jgi:formylglycine-generating enzyme required for sulfatase activity
MKAFKILFFSFLFLVALRQLPALTVPASEDTTAFQNKTTAAASFSPVLMVDSTRVAFVYFNLDDIPEGAAVKMARLRMYTSSVRSKGQGLGVHRVTSPWNEAIPGAQPSYEINPIARIEAATLGSRRFVTVDVTDLVRAWVNGGSENEGFAITSLRALPQGTSSPLANVSIASKEGPYGGLPSILDIEFENSKDAAISMEQLPQSVRDLAGSGTFKLSNVSQLPDTLRTFLSPTIEVQPSLPSEGGSLSVKGHGLGSLSYQWFRDGVALEGRTGPDFPTKNLVTGSYSVSVSNGFASVMSSPVAVKGFSNSIPPSFIMVQGGSLQATDKLRAVRSETFYICDSEVTFAEWRAVCSWAVQNGYGDLANTGEGNADNLPVKSVSWYEAVKWCNARSEKEGKRPVYLHPDGTFYRTGNVIPTVDTEPGGYRLPTDDEWEFAARGGNLTRNYVYSGSNSIDAIGWYSANTVNGLPEIRTKLPNELLLYDMTGNVWEWCFSLAPSVSSTTDPAQTGRVYRGGGVYTSAEGCLIPGAKRDAAPETKKNYIGLRVSLSIAR